MLPTQRSTHSGGKYFAGKLFANNYFLYFCDLRKDDENVLTVVNFLYTKPGPDAFFWAGGEGGCDDGSIDNRSQIQEQTINIFVPKAQTFTEIV